MLTKTLRITGIQLLVILFTRLYEIWFVLLNWNRQLGIKLTRCFSKTHMQVMQTSEVEMIEVNKNGLCTLCNKSCKNRGFHKIWIRKIRRKIISSHMIDDYWERSSVACVILNNTIPHKLLNFVQMGMDQKIIVFDHLFEICDKPVRPGRTAANSGKCVILRVVQSSFF